MIAELFCVENAEIICRTFAKQSKYLTHMYSMVPSHLKSPFAEELKSWSLDMPTVFLSFNFDVP